MSSKLLKETPKKKDPGESDHRGLVMNGDQAALDIPPSAPMT